MPRSLQPLVMGGKAVAFVHRALLGAGALCASLSFLEGPRGATTLLALGLYRLQLGPVFSSWFVSKGVGGFPCFIQGACWVWGLPWNVSLTLRSPETFRSKRRSLYLFGIVTNLQAFFCEPAGAWGHQVVC